MEQLIAILVTFLLGLGGYFFRADLERNRRNYVDLGIDQVINDAEYALSVYAQNWYLALRAMKTFREIPGFLTKEFVDQFKDIDQSKMKMSSARRVSTLTGSNSVWETYQLCFSFAGTRSQIIMYELVPALVSNLDTSDEQRLEICRVAEMTLEEMHADYTEHYQCLSHLCAIKDELDSVRHFSANTIREIPLRKGIRCAIGELEIFVGQQVDKREAETDSA